MIISASRRTDIPAFYADWFFHRIEAGSCQVPNPFNPAQVSTISLKQEDVEAIVFWSKNPAPLLPRLRELDDKGYRYYFLFTLNGYPEELEGNLPSLERRIETFCALSAHLGPGRVIWRYDPIIISNRTDAAWHGAMFGRIASALRGHTELVIVSLLDWYRKTGRNLAPLEKEGWVFSRGTAEDAGAAGMLSGISAAARTNGMAIQSCAQAHDWSGLGIPPGACINAAQVRRSFGINYPAKKDPGQREHCLCAQSRDIGVNDTCLHRCPYCYATRNHPLALARHAAHDPRAPMLFTPPFRPV